ncbi:hypothetical protein GCM10025864_14190 [Luteimicrobium album]|uniref:GH16 domain-containing protein n=1 Tax=Luteimicrobium album TaxID=1054550 RepID=A0ABQ6HZ08_9MICO|nr:glycoside hydrolase family 16 protein [Luteimicrobium album]GMA23660.1 hypothetical protein GCM10025864_14190 [Luteimicrobium album]
MAAGAPSATADSACADYKICVTSPHYGTDVSGQVTIDFTAPGMKNGDVRIWHQPDATHTDKWGYDRWTEAIPAADGTASATIDADDYPSGPMVVEISVWDSPPGDNSYTHSDNVYLSLFNTGGVDWSVGATDTPGQAAGLTLSYDDEFTGPLSISRTGVGTTYASATPYQSGGGEFGDAVFAEAGSANDPFTVKSSQYLRIRGQKAPDGFVDPQGWGRTYTSGFLASMGTDGQGFAASDAYFEARILMPGGYGTWPSFWVMGKNRITNGTSAPYTELDAVEQHGQSVSMKRTSQSTHCWACTPVVHDTHVQSTFAHGLDAGRTWHTYGVRVAGNEVNYYIDGEKIDTYYPADSSAHQPLFFMLDLAMGSGWPIDLSQQENKADMYVDYVRVWS